MRISGLTLLVSTLAAGCDGAKLDEVPLDCGSFSSSFATEDSMQQSVATFVTGETVTFHVRVTNTSSSAQTTKAETCPRFSFEIKSSDGQTVWEYGANTPNAPLMSCAPSGEYSPGETSDYAADWDQRQLGSNTQVSPGEYSVNAFDSTECSSALNKSAEFEIQ